MNQYAPSPLEHTYDQRPDLYDEFSQQEDCQDDEGWRCLSMNSSNFDAVAPVYPAYLYKSLVC